MDEDFDPRKDVLRRVKLYLRKTHTATDEDILADIDSCIHQLEMLGVMSNSYAFDPVLFNVIKLYCKISDTDDPAEAAALQARYDGLVASMQMARKYRATY